RRVDAVHLRLERRGGLAQVLRDLFEAWAVLVEDCLSRVEQRNRLALDVRGDCLHALRRFTESKEKDHQKDGLKSDRNCSDHHKSCEYVFVHVERARRCHLALNETSSAVLTATGVVASGRLAVRLPACFEGGADLVALTPHGLFALIHPLADLGASL